MMISITSNYRLALSMTAFYTAPAFAFVGVTFPTFDMNNAAQLWHSLVPISQLLKMQNLILHWHASFADIGASLATLGLFCMVFSVPSLWILRRKVSNPHYWYQH
jgi:ABC-2 type transport system permease protein